MPPRRFLPFDDDEPEPVRGPDGRWPTLDWAEQAIRHPGPFRASGAYRDVLVERRSRAEAELREVDRQLADASRRRRQLVDRIEGCNLAITGTSQIRDRRTTELLQRLPWSKRIPFTDPQPLVDPLRARVVTGRELCEIVVDLLQVTDQTLSIPAIERLLRLQNLVPAGRPSRTISNATSRAVGDGRVERVGRGRYRSARHRLASTRRDAS